ncbi:MAG: cobyrinate a,c-diamide synthase [Pseudomonadota bacterium]
MTHGILIAAPRSGSGKTVVTLGLLRALANAGQSVASFKAGPDYIDPAFHAAASGKPCFNLDPWGMRVETRHGLLAAAENDAFVVVEAMMGLFDGAADGTASAADLAVEAGLSVILVVDCAGLSHSVAALVKGYRDHRSDVALAGVILNRVGSPRHELMLRQALNEAGIAVFGALPVLPTLALPSRHLGLVQAGEHGGLDAFLQDAGAAIRSYVDLDALLGAGRPVRSGVRSQNAKSTLPFAVSRLAVARDEAFSFCYPHHLESWRRADIAVSFFSPLANEAPDPSCEAVYLPGGYPELHGARLAGNDVFLDGLRAAAERGHVYGECGGYMVLGDALVDAEGKRHAMAGLLPVTTSFVERRLSLGYRSVRLLSPNALFGAGVERFAAHEFHYSVVLSEDAIGGGARCLFECRDATGKPWGDDQGQVGLQKGRVMGSYMHIIDCEG